MNVQQTVPPQQRDFEAYRAVTVEQRTTREVAAELRISQTRVCQLLARVAAFLAEVIPPGEKADKEREIRVGEQIAAERVQYLYGLALRSFERSIGEQRSTRQSSSGIGSGSVVTTRTSPGDIRFLMCAGRLAVLAAKLPPPMMMESMAEEDGEGEAADNLANPPKEACSAVARERALAAAVPSPACVASAAPADVSVDGPVAVCDALQREETTVQLPKSQLEQKLIAGQRLSSADRKARKRLLERKLKQSRMAG